MVRFASCLSAAAWVLLCVVSYAKPDADSVGNSRAGNSDGGAGSEGADIVVPRLIGDAVVPYPEGQTEDCKVVLELLIDKLGAVQHISVVAGVEPFASVATQAAVGWLFDPARKNGVAMAARIRFEVNFIAPKPQTDQEGAEQVGTEQGASQDATGAEQSGAQPTREQQRSGQSASGQSVSVKPTAIDVYVYGERVGAGVMSMATAEVRQIPGVFGDPFRAIEVLPGVTPLATGVPFFYVRGAPPGNVGYYLDGIRVPLLYHVGMGPSVLHPGLISRVDLYSGGYPAAFGRHSGGIVAAQTTSPATRLRGEGNIRLLDAGALVENGWSDGDTSVSVGGRYSYTGLMLSLFAPDVKLRYWDYQLRGAHKVTDKDTLGLLAFGAYDYFGYIDDGKEQELFGSQFHRLDLRYLRDIDRNHQLRVSTGVGIDRTALDDSELVRFKDKMLFSRASWRYQPSARFTLEVGLDVQVDKYERDFDWKNDDSNVIGAGGATGDGSEVDRPPGFPDSDYPDSDVSDPPLGPMDEEAEDDSDNDEIEWLFPARTDVVVGMYTQAAWEMFDGFLVQPGLRVDVFRQKDVTRVGVDPRLGFETRVSDRVKVIHALGIAHQPPSFSLPAPGVQVGGLEDGLQSALQSSAGVHVKLPLDFVAQVTGFIQGYFNMTDTLGTIGHNVGEKAPVIFSRRSLGRSYGLEVYIKRSLTKELGGFVSYTLSRSTRSYGTVHRLFSFDRTHVLHGAVSYQLGRGWVAGGRMTWYSGHPVMIEREWFNYDPQYARELKRMYKQWANERGPGYFRLDLRVEKKWRVTKKGGWIAMVIELMNTTMSKETVQYSCSYSDGCTETKVGPVTVPSIGVEGAF